MDAQKRIRIPVLLIFSCSSKLHPVLTKAEVAHMLLPRAKVVNAYVLKVNRFTYSFFAIHLPPFHNLCCVFPLKTFRAFIFSCISYSFFPFTSVSAIIFVSITGQCGQGHRSVLFLPSSLYRSAQSASRSPLRGVLLLQHCGHPSL